MVKQYVGARYVPKFASPVEWAADTSYEALTIVTFNNASYTSKVQVPPTVGNPANNPQYWALTGNYNAQVEQYRQETETVSNNLTTEITNRKTADATLQGQITAEIINRKTTDATLQGQITTEITNRNTADAALQNNIEAETTARQTADNTLQGNINSEAATRASADSNLQSQINQIVAPSGEAPSAAEVQNARIGADGVTYDTLGTAIRTQVNNLNNDLKAANNRFLISNAGEKEFKITTTGFGMSSVVTLKLPVTTGNDANAFWIYIGNKKKKVQYDREPFSLVGDYYLIQIYNGQALTYDFENDLLLLQRDFFGLANVENNTILLYNNDGQPWGLILDNIIGYNIQNIKENYDAINNRYFVTNAGTKRFLYNYYENSENGAIRLLLPKTTGNDANSFYIYRGKDKFKITYENWDFSLDYPTYYIVRLSNGHSIKYNIDTGKCYITSEWENEDFYNSITLLNNNVGKLKGCMADLFDEAWVNYYNYGSGIDFMSEQKPKKNFNYTNAKKLGVVIDTISDTFMNGQVESPSIIYDDEAQKYRMVFTAYTAETIASIGYAESTDLITWTNIKQLFTCSGYEANGDKYGCTGPCLIKYNDMYYLFYIGLNGIGYEGKPTSICLATTENIDNPTWNYKGIIIADQKDTEWCHTVYHPNVIRYNDKWMIIFNAEGNTGNERSGFAISDKIDGNYIVEPNRISKFTEELNAGYSIQCGDPCFITIDDIVYMFYFSSRDFKTSVDSWAWTYKSGFPYDWNYGGQSTNNNSLYDNQHAAKPFVIKKDNKLYYYYTAVNSSNHRCIALQTFDL